MSVLLIGPAEIEELKSLATYASEHPMNMTDMIDRSINAVPPPGLLPEFFRMIPKGFKVVFTHEVNERGDPIRHLSVSVEGDGKAPTPAAVQLIMKVIGFENELQDCKIDMEDIDNGQVAINVGELITL